MPKREHWIIICGVFFLPLFVFYNCQNDSTSTEMDPNDEEMVVDEVVLDAEPGEEVSAILRSGVRALLRNESETTVKVEIIDLNEQKDRAVPGAVFPVQVKGLDETTQKTRAAGDAHDDSDSILELSFPHQTGFDNMDVVLRLSNNLYELAFPLNFDLTDFVDSRTGDLLSALSIKLPWVGMMQPDEAIVIALEGMDTTCGPEVYNIEGPLNYASVNDRLPVILVHGWQSTKRLCEQFKNFNAVSHMAFYKDIIENDSLLQENVAIFTYRYPTFVEIQEVAGVLASTIENAGWKEVAILGHSRGGLVGRVASALLPNRIGKTLITAGSPHQGTPIANCPSCPAQYVGVDAPLFQRLGVRVESIRRFFLDSKGASHMTPEAADQLADPDDSIRLSMIGAEVSALTDFSHWSYRAGWLWFDQQQDGIANDGIVPLSSAVPLDWNANITFIVSDIDHGHLRKGLSGRDEDLQDAIRTALLSAIDPAKTGRMYVSSGFSSFIFGTQGPSDLYLVEVSEDGQDQLLGRIQTLQGEEPVITDIAVDPSGELWAVSWDQLYRLDKNTFQAEVIGQISNENIVGLEFHTNGTLYAITEDGYLLTINSDNAKVTVVGELGDGWVGSGDIAIGPDGRMYGTVSNGGNSDMLVIIDLKSGRAAPVNPGTDLGFANVFGLSFVNDKLYGVTTIISPRSGHLIRIDPSTGTATELRKISFQATGAKSRFLDLEH